MKNSGIQIGSGANIVGSGINNIKNEEKKITIKIGHIIISISIILALLLATIIFINNNNKISLVGSWTTEKGQLIEFLSDGTIQYDGKSESLNPDTYEVMKEGYLKIGEYDAGWIQYRYEYFDMKYEDDCLILSLKDNPDNCIKLSRNK